jgi:hypothetical protein
MLRTHAQALLAAALALLAPAVARAQWTTLAPGIEHRVFEVGGHRYNVVRVDKGEPTAIIDIAVAGGEVRQSPGRWELVEDMASRTDDTIFYWEDAWGPTRDVIAATNGYYFDTSTAEIQGGMVMGGWYIKRHGDWGNGGFFWRPVETGVTTFISGCIHFRDEKNIVTYASGSTQPFDDINTTRGADELVIYTPHYSDNTHTSGGTEVLVELTRPLMIVNPPAGVSGTVVKISDSGSTPIPFDHVVLSADGSAASTLRSSVSVGDEILVSMEIDHYERGCSTPNPDHWLKPHSSIGRDFYFLDDGVIDPYTGNAGATAYRSRTAFAYDASYAYLVVEDEVSGSTGVDMQILGEFCRDTLGATHAATLDGGGSSKMWIKDRGVVNSPSDPGRHVVNSVQVISLQPARFSTAFLPGDTLEVTTSTPVRLGPGTNYAEVRTASAGETCTVAPHPSTGVWATGSHYLKCVFAGSSGWILESGLSLVDRPEPSPDASEPPPDASTDVLPDSTNPDAGTDTGTDTGMDWSTDSSCGCTLVC